LIKHLNQRDGYNSGKEKAMFDRIVSDPAILSGTPVVRGTRISVSLILEWIASGASRAEILAKHPHLTAEDIEQALGYAATATRNEVLITAEVHR
jgi:uncharacterized protein (DUF433 family)